MAGGGAAAAAACETKSVINLKGSAAIIKDFMDFSINMILYQREVYHDEEFEKVEKYGRPLFMTTNDKLRKYLDGVLGGLKNSIEKDECRKVVLVIIDTDTEDPVEKWEFEIEPEVNNDIENTDPYAVPDKTRTASKDMKAIQNQIMKIMKQIIGAVTYLPCRGDSELSFNILLYTKRKGTEVMSEWQECHAHDLIASKETQENVQTLNFDTLSTGVQTVQSRVCYKVKQDF